ncbi:MAG: NERD domain-containing protein [Lentisphaerae bacterium]|nr:NERD domain-containing protein [Lentisphaerota bacterium]
MVRRVGQSGSSARSLAGKRRQSINGLVLVGLSICVVFMLFIGSGIGAIGLGGMIFLLLLFKGATGFIEGEIKQHRKRERHALRGARGEDRIAETLDEFPDGYVVYHDVSTGNGDIDHVLISPEGGVFVLETKAHGGRVSFDGNGILINGKPPEKNFIGQVLHNVIWLKQEIKRQTGEEVWVSAALVFANAFVEWHRPIKGVHVINRKFLGKFLDESRPRRKISGLAEKVRLS